MTMGVDLTICPERWKGMGAPLLHDRLVLDRSNYDVWDLIQKKATKLNEAVDWYDDNGIERRTDDKYGEPLTYIMAGELFKIVSGVSGWTDYDMAAWAFVAALPAETRIILWWH